MQDLFLVWDGFDNVTHEEPQTQNFNQM